MTFPSIAGTPTSGNDSTNTQNHVITLPTGIQVGELLAVRVIQDGTLTMTWPAGWTQIVIQAGTGITLEVRCRIADGSEGASITVTTATNEAFSWQAARWQDWYGSDLANSVVGATASGSNANPDPPSVTAPWGSADNAFSVLMGWGTSVNNISAYPSNYTDNQLTDDDANANIAGIASATRNLAADTDNPGTATIGASDNWVASTIVIRPAAANVTVAPAAATAKGSAVNPVVVLGALSISPATVAAKGAGVAPSAILGSLSIAPAALTVRGASIAPTVGLGSVLIAPATSIVRGASVDPVVVLGSIVIAPAAVVVRAAGVDPVVQLGSILIVPGTVALKGLTIDPTVISGGGIVIVPVAATMKGSTASPSLVLGSLIISPSARSARTAGIDPTLQLSSITIAPNTATFRGRTVNPTVIDQILAALGLAYLSNTIIESATISNLSFDQAVVSDVAHEKAVVEDEPL